MVLSLTMLLPPLFVYLVWKNCWVKAIIKINQHTSFFFIETVRYARISHIEISLIMFRTFKEN